MFRSIAFASSSESRVRAAHRLSEFDAIGQLAGREREGVSDVCRSLTRPLGDGRDDYLLVLPISSFARPALALELRDELTPHKMLPYRVHHAGLALH